MNSKHREPVFHITKREEIGNKKAWTIRICAIIIALIVCAVLTTIITGDNPIAVYAAMVKGAFGTARKSWVTFQNISILLIISLALTPAFKMKFWNIGGEGQILMGGTCCGSVYDFI